MASIYWLIAFIILIAVELGTMALTTIWFAGGALMAFVLSLLGFGIEVQLVVFVVISFGLLFLTRPLAAKYLNGHTEKTNVESLIGKTARVTARIDNAAGTGTAVVNGQEWTARSALEHQTFMAGQTVDIIEVKGVKLIVGKPAE